jgi:DNA-binding NarL/FixJ family response regulator
MTSTLPSPERHDQAAPLRFLIHVAYSCDEGSGRDKTPGEIARILIVEDDFIVATECEIALREAGFEIADVVGSAEEAIQAVKVRPPKLIIMDIRLAGVRDGIDAALEIFREHGIRCIFASAHQDEHARRRAEPASPLAWLPKPYSMQSLIDGVQRALATLDNQKS